MASVVVAWSTARLYPHRVQMYFAYDVFRAPPVARLLFSVSQVTRTGREQYRSKGVCVSDSRLPAEVFPRKCGTAGL